MCHYTHFTTEEREKSRVLKAQGTATAFTFEEKRKKGQKEYQEKAWVREQP